MTRSVTMLAPAKINLFLQVLGKRADGFHEIYSLIQAVDLYDSLTVKESDSGISLVCDDPSLPCDSSNIAWSAAKLMQDRAKLETGVSIELTKRIPYGAGLGGGSSDAAAVMKAINQLFGLNLGAAQLAVWGAELGSDVPFFFSEGAALVSGRGDIVAPVEVFQQYFVLLIKPDFAISTKDAYQSLRLYLTKFSVKGHISLKTSGKEFFKTIHKLGNDFQRVVAHDHPGLESCMTLLRNNGAAHVALSGSGSAFYGLFEQPPDFEFMDMISSRFGWQVFSLKPVRLAQK